MKEADGLNRAIATIRTTSGTFMARMLQNSLPSSRHTTLTVCFTARRASVATSGQCRRVGSCAPQGDGRKNVMNKEREYLGVLDMEEEKLR